MVQKISKLFSLGETRDWRGNDRSVHVLFCQKPIWCRDMVFDSATLSGHIESCSCDLSWLVTQRQMNAVHSKEALAGKRVCRACGRPGHIASNVVSEGT